MFLMFSRRVELVKKDMSSLAVLAYNLIPIPALVTHTEEKTYENLIANLFGYEKKNRVYGKINGTHSYHTLK